MKWVVLLSVALVFASNDYAEARGGSGSIRISTHTGSSRSHSAASHTGSTRTSHPGEKPAAFKHATCKSPSCFQKHPTGEYMIPIYAKK